MFAPTPIFDLLTRKFFGPHTAPAAERRAGPPTEGRPVENAPARSTQARHARRTSEPA